MMKPALIAITGKKQSGKGTLAQLLIQMDYVQVDFADALRDVCRAAFDLTDMDMLLPTQKEIPLRRFPFRSPRNILQTVGTDLFREAFPGVWVEAWGRRAAKHELVVAADLRFLDEAARIRELGGVILRVVRPDAGEVDAHISEQEMDLIEVDQTIINDGGFTDLAGKLVKVLAEVSQ